MRRIRLTGVLAAVALLVGACSESTEVTGDGEAVLGNAAVSVADAELSVRADRDTVTVNGTELISGNFQPAVAGDVVAADGSGQALLEATSVFQIEALRGGTVTVPELAQTLDVDLEVGHIFVRLNPAAEVTLVVDAGERVFTTRSPDAEFALCQAPDGASCLAVLKGTVEWNEDGVATETYDAGEASFAPRGNAPEAPRCADQAAIGDMQRSLRGLDFAGALADIVATWEPCAENSADPTLAAATIPSAAGMKQVVADVIEIGSPDVDTDTSTVSARRTADGSANFFIEPVTATNGGFRSWLVTTAGDDADAWRRYAPADWQDRAPGGAATQSTYAEGTADEPVKGVTYETAGAYCASQGKRLATEIEWELAATGGVIIDLAEEAQDWVSEHEAYGPGAEESGARQVLRGNNGTLGVDPYYRVFALDDPEATAARQHARIRCAADEVAVGGRSFANVVFEDDFNSLNWPLFSNGGFELDYHPENYHLDVSNDHSQLAVVRSLDGSLGSGRIDVDVFIERTNTGTDGGAFRFGPVIGTSEKLHTLTVQPDEFGGTSFVACLAPMDPDMMSALKLEEQALSADSQGAYATVGPNESHYNEDCSVADDAVVVPVTAIDSPLRMSLVLADGTLEAWVNEVLVTTSNDLPGIDVYGFFSENYHRPRSHVHFDQITVVN